MTQEEAIKTLADAGLNARPYQWRGAGTHIRGGRPVDLSDGSIPVYRKAYDISELPDGSFDVWLMLGRGVMGIQPGIVPPCPDCHDLIPSDDPSPTLAEAVNAVIDAYRKEGLLP